MRLSRTPPVKVIATQGLQRSEEHTSELQSRGHLVCSLLLEKKKIQVNEIIGIEEIKQLQARYFRIVDEKDSPAVRRLFFVVDDASSTEIYTLSLHDALPI